LLIVLTDASRSVDLSTVPMWCSAHVIERAWSIVRDYVSLDSQSCK
jgi:hypothetical protein